MTAHVFALAARLCIASFFIVSGLTRAVHADSTIRRLALGGIPAPTVIYTAMTAIALLGGLLLVLGSRCRLVALALALLLAGETYWFVLRPGGSFLGTEMLENVAILGGLLQIAAFGGGRFGLDRG